MLDGNATLLSLTQVNVSGGEPREVQFNVNEELIPIKSSSGGGSITGAAV